MITTFITVSHDINPEFLRIVAGLSKDDIWGVAKAPNGETTIFFLEQNLPAVQSALGNYGPLWLENRKAAKLEELAAIRKEKELKGPNGLVLDDKTIARLSAASLGLLIDQSRESVRWEISRGNFIELPRQVLLGLSVQSVNIVQACFDNVYEKTQIIKAITITTNLADALAELAAVDLTTGWP